MHFGDVGWEKVGASLAQADTIPFLGTSQKYLLMTNLCTVRIARGVATREALVSLDRASSVSGGCPWAEEHKVFLHVTHVFRPNSSPTLAFLQRNQNAIACVSVRDPKLCN